MATVSGKQISINGEAQSRGDVLTGVAVGMVAGFVASWVMNQFQQSWTRKQEGFAKGHGAQSMQPSEGSPEPEGPVEQEKDDATVKIARTLFEGVLGRKLKNDEKETAGTLVHYAFGIGMGATYGAMAEVAPAVTAAVGIPFGVVFWVIADEIVVPALGLSKGPTEYPLSTHAYSLASHVVYGVTAEAVRRPLRAALNGND